jgi:hypothetical protein
VQLLEIAVIGRADDFRQQARRHLHRASLNITKVTFVLALGTDDEKAIRWLIALMALRCDPLAIALTAAVSVRRSTV